LILLLLKVKIKKYIKEKGESKSTVNPERNLMVVDTFGTADEDRFWDAREFEQGRYVERSKEFVRQYYRSIGYYDELMKARKEGKEEPQIPPLPEDMIKKVSEIYIKLFEDITGEPFRMMIV
jgi:phosphoribosylaminoimidazole-succinocarboxamide synthase